MRERVGGGKTLENVREMECTKTETAESLKHDGTVFHCRRKFTVLAQYDTTNDKKL